MSPALLPRVRFRERQPLTEADLNAEQAHRLALRRRHNAGQHGWGIVAGLALVQDDEGLLVDAGMAADGYGRELVLPAPVLIGYAALGKAAGAGTEIMVSLLYGREPAGRDRWREVCRLRLTAGGSADPLPSFEPHQTPPDGRESEWPVPLGIVTLRDPGPGLDIDPGNRVYATLIGEEIRDPAGCAHLAFGRVEGRERLALGLRTAEGGTVERLAVERLPVPPPVRPRPECPLRIAAAPPPLWKATVRARARTRGVRLRPLEDGGPRGVQFSTPIPVPKAPSPWRIYRVAADPEGAHPAELRFEIGHPGDKGDPTTHKLVAGDPAILPWLTVTADCTTTVHGDLVVEGQLVRAPVPANPNDPAFKSAVAGTWNQGIMSSLDHEASFEPTVVVSDSIPAGQAITYTLILKNTGRADLSDVGITETLVAGAFRAHREVLTGLILPAGQSISGDIASRSFADAGPVSLVLTILAVGPRSSVLHRTVTKHLTIFNPSQLQASEDRP